MKLILIFLIVKIYYNWYEAGHMVTCNIAKKLLKKNKFEKFEKILKFWQNRLKTEYDVYIESCVLPDKYEAQFEGLFPKWHFYDKPIKNDGDKTEYPYIDLNNGYSNIKIINFTKKLLSDYFNGNKNINKYFLSYLLRYLLHSFGDLHQPLHNESFYSKEFPNGDLVGNLIPIDLKEFPETKELHALLDSCVGITEVRTYPYNKKNKSIIENITENLMKRYTQKDLKKETEILDSEKISNEGTVIAKNEIYSQFIKNPLSPNKKLDLNVIKKICEKRITLGGYRLAKLLDQIIPNNIRLISK